MKRVYELQILEQKQSANSTCDSDQTPMQTLYISGLMPRYFPFPQPASIITEPGVCSLMNSATLGQALCRVSLK